MAIQSALHWLEQTTDMSSIVITTLGCLLVALLVERFFRRASQSMILRVGRDPRGLLGFGELAKARAEFLENGKKLADQGYAKYRDSMYLIQTVDMDRLIVGNRYLEELRQLPPQILSSIDAICDRHLAFWNGMDHVKTSQLHTTVTKGPLRQNLGRICEGLHTEAETALSKELSESSSSEWQTAVLHNLSTSVVTRTVNRAIVGETLCQNNEWLKLSFGYAAAAFELSNMLRPHSWWIRPWLYWTTPIRPRLQAIIARAHVFLEPEIERRRVEGSKHLDMLQWLVDSARGHEKSYQMLVQKTLFLCLASVSTSSQAITNVILDLCAHPEYVDPLRDEIDQAVADEGWSLPAIQKMHKLDSLIRESHRYNPSGLFSFHRKVRKTFQLSDGTTIPAGTFISTPSYHICRDPAFYEAPLEFQPFRFAELREKDPSHAGDYMLTSTRSNHLAFGWGNLACPGRQFAACEMKLILALILRKYEFRLPDGQTKRPENICVDARIWPSKTQAVEFRLRE